MSGADVPFGGGGFGAGGAGGAAGGNRTTAPVELIDIVFALSNISLVREIVQQNLIQLQDLGQVSKGQTEGLRAMIMDKQKQVFADLSEIEHLLRGIIDEGAVAMSRNPARRNFNLSAQQSKALIYAISFSISHLVKFIPGAGGGSNVPGVII